MIAATILPLAAGNQEQAIALAGMLALLVGRHHRQRGPRQARVRRRPALEPGPDRVPGGTRGGHPHRPAAEAVRVLDRCRRTHRRGRRVPPGSLEHDQPLGAGHRPAEPGHHPWPQAAGAARRPASWSPSSWPSGSRSSSTSPRTASTSSACCPRASPCRPSPRSTSTDIPVLFACGARHLAGRHRATRSRRRAGSPGAAGYEVDGNQELAGIGSANLAAGLFSGFPVSTSGSRTAVAFQSGAKTQLTGLVAAALVLLMLAVRAGPRPGDAPAGARGGGHRRIHQPVRRSPSCAACTRSGRTEFGLAVACALGVALVGVLQGIVIAVALSVVYIFSARRGSRTPRSWARHPASLAGTTSGAIPNADRSRGCSSSAGPRRSSSPTRTCSATASASWCRAADAPPKWILVAAEPITDIDTTAGAMLADLDLELNARGIHLAFAELQTSVARRSCATACWRPSTRATCMHPWTRRSRRSSVRDKTERGPPARRLSRAPTPPRPQMTRGLASESSGTRRTARAELPGSG